MILAGLLFVAVTVMVRILGSDLSASQAAFIRYIFGIVLLIPVLKQVQWKRAFGIQFKSYFIRGIAHGVAVTFWFYAMTRISIAEVTAIGYTTPIFTAIGAVIIFGERLRIRRIFAIIIGFIGTLIILRPGFGTIDPGSIAQLMAAILFSASFLFTKHLTNSESSTDIVVMLSIFCALALLPGAIYTWQAPTIKELGWLMMIAVFATAGHYALTRSVAHAPLTVIQPFSFLQLIWAIAFGYFLFDETPDMWVISGAIIIVASISYLTHRETIANRKTKSPPLPPNLPR